jgi:hypothetical protein
LSLSLVTDSRLLPNALAFAEPPLHHHDQPPEELELKVVVEAMIGWDEYNQFKAAEIGPFLLVK